MRFPAGGGAGAAADQVRAGAAAAADQVRAGAAASDVDVRRLRYELNRSAQSKHPRGAITGADTDPRDLRGGTGWRHRKSAPRGVRDA